MAPCFCKKHSEYFVIFGVEKKEACKIHDAGFSLVELLVVITITGMLGALFLSVQAKARVKANRAKCISNLRQIGVELISFGHDNDGLLPWQLIAVDQTDHFGSYFKERAPEVFGIKAMKKGLKSADVLFSPCDQAKQRYNKLAIRKWAEYSTKQGLLIPSEAISYDLARGANTMEAQTVLAVTRNISSNELMAARWLGGGEANSFTNAMSGLLRGQGHMLLTDGSIHFSNNSDLGLDGHAVRSHVAAVGDGFMNKKMNRWVSSTGVLKDADHIIRKEKHDGITFKGSETFIRVMIHLLDTLKERVPAHYKIAKREVTSINEMETPALTGGPVNPWNTGAYIVLAHENCSINCAWNNPPPTSWARIHIGAMGALINEIQHADFDGDGSEEACNWAIWEYGDLVGLEKHYMRLCRLIALANGFTKEKWDNRYNRQQ